MTAHQNLSQRRTRTGLALAAAAALIAGAAWHGVDAQTTSRAATATIPAVTAPITHAIAGGRDSYADVVSAAAPAVVTIRTQGKARVSPTQFGTPGDPDDFFRRFFGEEFGQRGQRGPRQFAPRQQRALGSGVIVSKDGYILTNDHVIENADDIKVETTDDRTFTAKLVGTDKASDLALVKVTASDLQAIALGNPLGVGQTVTMGIISAKGRSTGVGDGGYEDFLQTDAPINHGNSGGALVNMKGELVGINSQILSESGGNIGIGFAIPVNMAKNVMEQLRTKGKVTRSQLGVTVQGVTSDLAESLGLKDASGAIVSSVAPGSAAERAGVKRGDVIRSFNGIAVHDTNTLRNRVAEAGPGTTSELVIVRDGSEKRLSVKLDEASAGKPARAEDDEPGVDDKAALGVSVMPLTPELAARAKAPKDARGLFVGDVDPDGRAAAAGIQPGDIIQEVNRQAVSTVEDLRAAVKKSGDKPTLLLIQRQGNDIFVTVRPANG